MISPSDVAGTRLDQRIYPGNYVAGVPASVLRIEICRQMLIRPTTVV